MIYNIIWITNLMIVSISSKLNKIGMFCEIDKSSLVHTHFRFRSTAHEKCIGCTWLQIFHFVENQIFFSWLCLNSLGCEMFGFFSYRSLKGNKNILVLLRLYIYFLMEVCSLFNFWMIKFTIMSKENIIVNFVIQKLKSKHTPL